MYFLKKIAEHPNACIYKMASGDTVQKEARSHFLKILTTLL